MSPGASGRCEHSLLSPFVKFARVHGFMTVLYGGMTELHRGENRALRIDVPSSHSPVGPFFFPSSSSPGSIRSHRAALEGGHASKSGLVLTGGGPLRMVECVADGSIGTCRLEVVAIVPDGWCIIRRPSRRAP